MKYKKIFCLLLFFVTNIEIIYANGKIIIDKKYLKFIERLKYILLK